MHSIEGVTLTISIILFQAIHKHHVVNKEKEKTEEFHSSTFPSSAVKQKEGEKNDLFTQL